MNSINFEFFLDERDDFVRASSYKLNNELQFNNKEKKKKTKSYVEKQRTRRKNLYI